MNIFLFHQYAGILQWLKLHMLPCFFKSVFHAECPGCGFQRSVISLLEGNITESFSQYHATVPVLLLFIFAAMHLKFRFKKGNTIIQYSYIFIAILIGIDFLYKQLILK